MCIFWLKVCHSLNLNQTTDAFWRVIGRRSSECLRCVGKIGLRVFRKIAILIVATSFLSSPASARGLNGAAVGFGLLGAVMGMAIAQQAYAHRGVRRHPFQRAYYGPRRRAALVPREVSVRPDRETTLLSFYNCNGPIAVTASASSGFIKQRHSTRFDCGNPDQPVIEFVYLGPSSGVGGDFVRYLEHGRTKAVDHIAFNLNAPIQETPQLVRITNFDERWIWRAWDCNNGPIPLSASARSGYTVIRDNVANVCGEETHPVKEVVYRSAEGFVGSDSVTIKSATRAPVEIPIAVSGAAPTSNIAAREPVETPVAMRTTLRPSLPPPSLVALSTPPAPQTYCTAPPVQQGLKYARAREIVIQSGFFAPTLPANGYSKGDEKVISECDGDVGFCNKYPEIETCGTGHCRMNFTDAYGNTFTVITYGDEGAAEVTGVEMSCKK